jgi:hypothetical protein
MAHITADRVRETSTTTGTGSYTLAGAVTGFRAFSAVCADGDTVDYTVTDDTGWEVGIGTWSTGGTLARTTILASSNSNSAVDWAAGTRKVFLTLPAARVGTWRADVNAADFLLTRPYLKNYAEVVTAPTISGGTLTLDLENGNIFDVALNAAITTLTISNPPATGRAGSFTLIFTADGTPRAVTWGGAIKWPGGTAPTLTSTNAKKDVFVFQTVDGGTSWLGIIAGQNF